MENNSFGSGSVTGMSYTKPEEGEEIVITGMSGKFAACDDIYHLRQNLYDKVNMVAGNFGKWQVNPELPKFIGKIDDLDKFDLGFFGITSCQADNMDPQLRISLEKTCEAILDAGYSISDLEGTNTAIYVATFLVETGKTVFYENLSPSGDALTGASRSMIPKRISYLLKMKGPALQLDSACSSTLYAIEHAYTALRNGFCERAIVCSSHLCLHAVVSLQFAKLGVLSNDGRCKSFDNSANGYARSEGICAILLEKSKTARRLYAEVIYVKTDCDGFKEEGITFPSGEAQRKLLKEFYEDCKIDTSLLTYIEAHGTGTKVGDPEELDALDKIFCKNREAPLYIGSIKSNIGHLEPASAMTSIVKVVIAMETGIVPPNINYTIPNQQTEALLTGRMKVITEKMPLTDNNSIVGINNFGIGGAKAHILLGRNPKPKLNNGQPTDNLPRLICVSSRAGDGVVRILDNVSSTNCDAEFAYLIQQAFRNPPPSDMYRGYGIFSKKEEIARFIKRFDEPIGQQLHLTYGSVHTDILKLGYDLIEIPIFSRTIQSIQTILLKTVDINLLKLFKNSAERSFEQILSAIAIEIALADILKEVELTPIRISGTGSGLLIAAYAKGDITLEQTVMGSVSVAVYVSKSCRKFYEIEKDLELVCVKYLNEQGIDTTNLRENKYDFRHTISMIIQSDLQRGSTKVLPFIKLNSQNNIEDMLTCLGSLYMSGFSLDLAKLYPRIVLPVSRGTPMISPLIRWSHERSCKVHNQENETTTKSAHKTIHIIPKSVEWSFVSGHVVDGRNLFPASGYLSLVWTHFAEILGKPAEGMKIVFEDVKFIRATTVPEKGGLQITIYIAEGKQSFEIVEGRELIVTGKVYEQTSEQMLAKLPLRVIENDGVWLTEKDIYREFKIRGHQYSGKFKNLKRCKLDLSQAEIKWEGNWVTFLDCILQLVILRKDSRDVHLPTDIQQLIINGSSILKAAFTLDNKMPVFIDNFGIIRTIGLEVKNIGSTTIRRRRTANPVLEVSKFIPNITQLDLKSSIRCFVQFVLENVDMLKVNVLEIALDHQEQNDLIFSIIQEALEDVPIIQQDITILTDKNILISGVNVRNKAQATPSCSLLIVSNLLETMNEAIALNSVKDCKGFIISREKPKVDLNKFVNTSYTAICCHTNEFETLVLLRPALLAKQQLPRCFLDMTNALPDLQWLPQLQEMLKENNKVVLYAQNEHNGILGLITCLKKEYGTDKICCVFTIDNAPKFDPELNFYKEQLEKNLSVNIWKDKAWGTYRHLILPQLELVPNEHCYISLTTKGDMSTLTWTEGKCSPEDIATPGAETIYIYYTALNFRDFMTATGRIIPDVILKNRTAREYLQGLEFAGRNSRGERVAGLCNYGSLATIIRSDHYYPIPDHWTMEDAVTVNVVYATLIHVFLKNSYPKPGKSILIHSGAGGIGLAAINLSLYFGFMIFVTVGTSQKRDFIKKTYPQIKEEHIGNSRDTSFENMIKKYTKGRGVDYVLNSFSEEKLLASVRCLAKGGCFYEIGKHDLANNNVFSLHLLEKDARFVGLSTNSFFESHQSSKFVMGHLINLIHCGAIKPLPRNVFDYKEIGKAFKYMGSGKNIGKVVIKIRDEERARICQVGRQTWGVTPKFHCKSKCSYIICGGLGGFGLELADFLVLRGAKKVVLTGRSGLCNSYQHYRIGIWNNYGVKVLTSSLDAANEEDCIKLLKLANELGPIDGIFNLAAVLKDGLFENQTVESFEMPLSSKAYATKNLDRVSRQLCPYLRYFVVFSSLSCGRGNTGQTNYGMANSVMERICEERNRMGYSGIAIQWGTVGDVGLVANMQDDGKELSIAGTIQQSVSSCLQVLDKLLKQKEPIIASMVLAAKKQVANSKNMFNVVLDILGIVNLKATSLHATFPLLGMDSLTAVEIKQTMENQYGVFLTTQDVKSMTLSKLRNLSDTINSDVSTHIELQQFPKDVQLMLHFIGNEKMCNIPAITIGSAIDGDTDAPNILVLPGIGGMSVILKPLCECLKGHAIGLQYCPEYESENIEELAEIIFRHVQSIEGEIVILAYSFGCLIATELLLLLEENGKRVRIIFVDGSPEMVTDTIKTYFPADNENLFQTMLLCFLMAKYMLHEDILKHKDVIFKHPTFEEKVEYVIKVSPEAGLSKSYRMDVWKNAYKYLMAARTYKVKGNKFKSPAILFRAAIPLISNLAADYGLSSLFESPVEVRVIEGNHVTILENNSFSQEINKVLESLI